MTKSCVLTLNLKFLSNEIHISVMFKNFHNSLIKQLRVSVFSSQHLLSKFLAFKMRLHHRTD